MILDQFNKLSFTDTEITIRDYLLQSQNQLLNLTISELAQATYTSNASIIRFCKKLGYKGYKDFLIAYIKEIESNRYTTSMVNYDFPFEDGRPNEILKGLTQLYKEASDLCLKSIDLSAIEKVVTLLMNAKRIFIFAGGDTLITAQAFVNRLIKLNLYPVVVKDEHVYTAQNITKEDCVIFVSYGLRSKTYETYFNIIYSNQAKTVLISANDLHPISKKCTCYVGIPDKEGAQKVSTFYSQFMFEFIFNLIYSRLYACNKSSRNR